MLIEIARSVVLDRSEQGTVQIEGMPRQREVFLDETLGHRVNRNETDLFPLAFDAEMNNSLTALDVPHPKQTELLTADAVIEKSSEHSPITSALDRVSWWRIQKTTRLSVAKRGCAALIVVSHGTFYAVDRISENCIALAKVVEKR